MRIVAIALMATVIIQQYAIHRAAQDVGSYWIAIGIVGNAFREQRKMLAVCEAGGLEAYREKARKELMEKMK